MPFDPDKALNEMKPQGGFNPDLALAEMQPQQSPGPLTAAATPPTPLTAQDARTAFGQPPEQGIVDKLFGAYDAVTQRSQIGANRIETALQQYATTPREPTSIGAVGENLLKGVLKAAPEMAGAVLNDIREFGPGYAAAKFGTGVVDFFVGQGQDILSLATSQPVARDRKGISGEFEEAYRGLVGQDFTAPAVPGFFESGSETRQRILEDPAPLALAAVGGVAAKARPQLRFAKESVKGAIDIRTGRAVSEQIARGPEARLIQLEAGKVAPKALKAPEGDIQPTVEPFKKPTIPDRIVTAKEPSKVAREVLPVKGKTPETIAKELDLVFNGMQERPKGKPSVFTFTDKKTGSTFLVDDLAKVQGRLREVKKSFGKPKVGAVEKVTKPKQGKQAWEMTREEYVKSGIDRLVADDIKRAPKDATFIRNTTENNMLIYHKGQVKKALSEGRPVPESVLKDYPDLVKKKPLRMDGTVRPERVVKPVKPLPQKSIDLYHKVMAEGDINKVQQLIHPDNKTWRKMFTEETGLKLPKTVKGSYDIAREWLASRKPPDLKPPAKGKVETPKEAVTYPEDIVKGMTAETAIKNELYYLARNKDGTINFEKSGKIYDSATKGVINIGGVDAIQAKLRLRRPKTGFGSNILTVTEQQFKKLQQPPIELHAGLTPKVVGETFKKTIPNFIKQLRHRFKTESGKSLVKDVETADTKYRRRQGQQIEKFRQAGIYRGSRFRKGGLKSEAQREGLADALEGLKTDNAKLIPDEMVKAGKRIFDEMYFKAKAVGVDVTGYRKKYFPRVMKQEIGEIIFNDLKSKSQKFKELINLNQTDQVLIDLVERLADSKQFKPKTIEALKHLIKTGQAKNYGEAFRLLREQSTGDMFRPFGNLEKPRIIELPKEYYERDALKIISRYTDSWAQRLAEIEIWGKDGSKAIKKFNEIQKTNPEEAKLAETMVDMWSGEYERTRGLTGSMRKFVDFMTAFQFGTKIGLGTATVPNTTQMLISAMVAAGPYRFAKGLPAVLKAKGRSWIRSSGSTIVTAMRTMAGYEPGGLMGKVADRLSRTSLFHGVNKLNQYLSAATADVFIKDLHRIYNTTKFGKRKAWAKSWLDKFNVDPSKKLTENIRQEVMYRFATDSQLQKNILNDALFFNTAYGRPLALFKRFGFRQAAWIKDVVFKQELIGNKNPLPLLRLVAGGIIGGEFVIWAKNNIRQFISGEPVYRKDDDIWERVLNDLAAVGSAGVLTDIISADNYASSLKFAATPVYVSDAIKAYKVLEQTELDRRKYDDWAIVALRTPSRAGQFFGSLPKYLTKRLQTTGQQKGRLRFFKGRERTKIIDLILDKKGEQAGKRMALWNQNYPHSLIEIGFDDIKRKIISKTQF